MYIHCPTPPHAPGLEGIWLAAALYGLIAKVVLPKELVLLKQVGGVHCIRFSQDTCGEGQGREGAGNQRVQ